LSGLDFLVILIKPKNIEAMRFISFFIIMIFLCLCPKPAHSQIDIIKRAKKKTENKINNKINKKVDEGLEKVFDEDSEEEKEKGEEQSEPTQGNQDSGESIEEGDTPEAGPALNWSKYDFIPGSEVIFEDNQVGEENGEFPSRWDLVKGRVEMAEFGDKDVIYFLDAGSLIVPYLKNAEEDYLPGEYTIEFDGWFEKDEYTFYEVFYYDKKKQKQSSSHLYSKSVTVYVNGAKAENTRSKYPGVKYEYNTDESIWRHIAISFNRRALKVYLDDARIINIPNMEINPTGITLGIDGHGTAGVKGINRFVKNFRVAKGAVKLYDKLLSDGKIIANGIRFDVGNSTIRPESMGIINEVVEMMEDHPELSFSIEGHTDSDGDDDLNLKLSEERAKAVKQAIVDTGIESSRLTTKGLGESNPVSDNTSPEGKANNRRVEFVKL